MFNKLVFFFFFFFFLLVDAVSVVDCSDSNEAPLPGRDIIFPTAVPDPQYILPIRL